MQINQALSTGQTGEIVPYLEEEVEEALPTSAAISPIQMDTTTTADAQAESDLNTS